MRLFPRLKVDDDDEGIVEDIDLDNNVGGGGNNFLRRFTVPNDNGDGGEEGIKPAFSLTGDNP